MRLPSLGMAVRVWRRNALIFWKVWPQLVVPLSLDPVLYFLALGYGLGGYVPDVDGVPYRDFLAPALCATSAMWGATFEATHSFFARMQDARTHDNILTTPIEAEDVALGELLWMGTRGVIYGSVFLLVIAVMGYVHSFLGLVLLPFLFVGGVAFGAMGMSFGLAIKKADYFSYYYLLVLNPLFLFGAVFFPVDALPGWAQVIAWCTPLLHLGNLARTLCSGGSAWAGLGDAAWLLVATTVLALLPLYRLRRRLVA